MIILALDLASVTGIAVGSPGGAPTAWSVDLGAGRSEDHRFSQALVLTHKLIEAHKPDLLAIEAPIGGKTTSHFLVGLVACVRGYAHNRKVRVVRKEVAEIRKHFLGGHITSAHYKHIKNPRQAKEAARNAGKAAVMQRCKALGWDAQDYDAADACALWDLVAALESRSHQITSIPGLFAQGRTA
jgi:hypothetical protein